MVMMKRRLVLNCLLSWAVLGSFSSISFAASDDPVEFVLNASNAILDKIRKDPKLHQADPEKVRELVDHYILPTVDFVMMTRMAVGPAWRKANNGEREALVNGFEELLMSVYSGGLSSVKNQSAYARPTRNKPEGKQAVVRTLLKNNGSADLAIDYRLYRNRENKWKIIDVNIEGIWLVENYRSQFAGILSNGGIPALIESLNKQAKNHQIKK